MFTRLKSEMRPLGFMEHDLRREPDLSNQNDFAKKLPGLDELLATVLNGSHVDALFAHFGNSLQSSLRIGLGQAPAEQHEFLAGLAEGHVLVLDYVKAARAGAIPTVPPDPTYVVLEHGMTLGRASKIFLKGPDANYVEPGGTRAGGFSTAKVDSPTTPIGTAADYAAGKASAFPNEGGPAVLRIAVPKNIYDKAIRVGNEVRFEKGHGLEELQANWNKSIFRYAPKQQ